jgi:hypothetical protein
MKRRMNRVMDRDSDHVLARGDLTVSLAVLQAAPKAKSKHKPAEYAARFAIEKPCSSGAIATPLRCGGTAGTKTAVSKARAAAMPMPA